MKGIPAKEIAADLSIDYSTYCRLENGRIRLTENRVDQILGMLNLSRSFVEKLEEYSSDRPANELQLHDSELRQMLALTLQQIEDQKQLIETMLNNGKR